MRHVPAHAPKLAQVVKEKLPENRRVLVVSDVHGNLPLFKGALEKAKATKDDIIVFLGDLVEKGKESLVTLRYIMDMQKEYDCRFVCGNCDSMAVEFAKSGRGDKVFFYPYLTTHPDSLMLQMGRPFGIDHIETLEDLEKLRKVIRKNYQTELEFIRKMPTILDTEDILFIHGGVPSQENMDQLIAFECMKNDNFAEQGVVFDKWCVVGHTPTTLYRTDIQSSAPYILEHQKLISIDGGCSLKWDGQLNILIFEDCHAKSFSWVSYDGLPVVEALEDQEGSTDSFNLRWREKDVEVLEAGEEFSRIRCLANGRELDVLTDYLYETHGRICCEDATDNILEISRGDKLGVVRKTSRGLLAKKDGVSGWYRGKYLE